MKANDGWRGLKVRIVNKDLGGREFEEGVATIMAEPRKWGVLNGKQLYRGAVKFEGDTLIATRTYTKDQIVRDHAERA